MQANRMPEARALYEKDLARTEADGGMLFRYAVTLHATGEQSAAQPRFETAIREKQYLPGAEVYVVTKPQPAAQRVAQRSALMARKATQEISCAVAAST